MSKTKLVRIPSHIPTSVISEAIKKSQLKESKEIPDMLKSKINTDLRAALDELVNSVEVDETLQDVVMDAHKAIYLDADDDEIDASNDILNSIGGLLKDHIKSFKIDWSKVK